MRPVLKLRWAVLLVQRMTSDDDFPGSNPNLNLALMAGKCSRLYFFGGRLVAGVTSGKLA